MYQFGIFNYYEETKHIHNEVAAEVSEEKLVSSATAMCQALRIQFYHPFPTYTCECLPPDLLVSQY